jgi:hypothetical protein
MKKDRERKFNDDLWGTYVREFPEIRGKKGAKKKKKKVTPFNYGKLMNIYNSRVIFHKENGFAICLYYLLY